MSIKIQVESKSHNNMEVRKFLNERNGIIKFDLGDKDRIITIDEDLADSHVDYRVAIVMKENSVGAMTYFMVVTDKEGNNIQYERELKSKIPPDLGA